MNKIYLVNHCFDVDGGFGKCKGKVLGQFALYRKNALQRA